MKKIIQVLLFLTVLCCSGCGEDSNESTKEVTVEQTAEYGYRVAEVTMDDEVDSVCSGEDKLYYTVTDYVTDEEGRILQVCSIYQLEKEKEAQPCKIGELSCGTTYMDINDEMLYLLELSFLEERIQQTVYQWSIPDGELVAEIELVNEQNSYPMAFEVVKDGFCLWNGDEVTVYDATGAKRWSFEQEHSILSVCGDKNNVIVCVRRFDGVNSHTEFQKLDIMSGQMQKKWESSIEYDIEEISVKNENELWVVNSRNGVTIYHMDTDEYEQIISWMEEGISDIYVEGIMMSDESSLQMAVINNGTKSSALLDITYGLLEKENTKTEILFSMPFMEDSIKEAIVQFNKTNPDYRIVVQASLEDELYNDYRSKLGRELATGNAADIFLLPPEDYENYQEKGLLLDLAPLFEDDDEIRREDYFQKVWERYEEGECLYAVPTIFSLETVVSKEDIFSQSGGWTLEEMRNTVTAMPRVTDLINAHPKEELLKYCCISMVAQEQLADLDSQELISILEFADQYGTDADRMKEYEGQMYHMMDEEQNLLMYMNVNNVDTISLYRTLMNGEINVIGYPAESPVLAYISCGNVIAIRADSEYAKGAWEFLKVLLSEKVQQKQYSFPVLKKVLEQWISASNPETSGNVREGIYINDYYLPVEKPEKEDIYIIKELIENSVPYPYETEFLLDIICEEASGYFNGQKTAQEVADIIKNRVQLYYMEQGDEG